MNCTKEYAEELCEKFLDREWEKIKQIPLPDTREVPVTEAHLKNEFESLCTRQLSNKAKSDIIHVFHPSLMQASRQNHKSPVEFWEAIQQDHELFKKFYKNRLMHSDWFVEKNGKNHEFLERGEVPPFIYAIGCTTGHFAEVPSYFKPALAKNLLQQYAPEAKSVIDCFSGYSGRMLGVLAAGMSYCGIDINDITVAESNRLISWLETNFPKLKGKAEVTCGDALKSTGTADVFLSCPPYLKNGKPIEVWQSSTGKVICEQDADEIIEYVLKHFDCEKYIFVFDSGDTKFSDHIVQNLENINYINARNQQITSQSHNYEAVLLFTKADRKKILGEI